MPAGLDGNPEPIVTEQRSLVLAVIAQQIVDRKETAPGSPLMVAVDGIDGSGKSTFADEVADVLVEQDQRVIRSTVDSFHNPRSVRLARGAASPVGFYYDSHDLDALRRELLDPFAKGSGEYVLAVFDEPSDSPVAPPLQSVTAKDILLFDGIFAHRPELADYWHMTIFLDGQERVNLGRLECVLDDVPVDPVDVVSHVLAWDRKIDRYSSGMQYYLDLVNPIARADVVIDNNDIAHPRIL